MIKPLSGDADIAARWQPHRANRRPEQCRMGQKGFKGLCWVSDASAAITSATLSCNGCGGKPTSYRPPTPEEILRYSANPSPE